MSKGGHLEVKENPVNMEDPIDRVNRATVVQKLEYICGKAAESFGRDPRGGGFSFVGQPRIIDVIVSELEKRERQLQRVVVVGTFDADIVMWWKAIPFRVRHTAKGEQLWVCPNDMIPESKNEDRMVAGQIRLAAWKGEIRIVQ